MTAFQHGGAGVGDQGVFKNIKGRKRREVWGVLRNKIKYVKKTMAESQANKAEKKPDARKRISYGKSFI